MSLVAEWEDVATTQMAHVPRVEHRRMAKAAAKPWHRLYSFVVVLGAGMVIIFSIISGGITVLAVPILAGRNLRVWISHGAAF